ncbi:MAG: decarboxylating 6-phosphogluconate dehydrogenase [Lautropia sp.]|nr:decarboxylating 6-phosphogluconate dehydrogenase [Lautropia sp.]
MNSNASSLPADGAPPALLMVGLGRMGANMARRLAANGATVHGHDRSMAARAALAGTTPQFPVTLHEQLSEAVAALAAPRMIWLMLPAGAPTQQTIDRLLPILSPGDILIDGGNANYLDSKARGQALAARGVEFVDCGVSGGIWGLQNGYCLMYGASPDAAGIVAPVMRRLAVSATDGWLHCGPVGAGHFVKMIHNGIEYGRMQSLAAGFALLAGRSDFELKLGEIGELWRHGSVVKSWLLDLTAQALQDPDAINQVAPVVADSGEGRWTVEESMRQGTPAPVIAMAMMSRFDSQGKADTGNKLLALMRKGFGGHAVTGAPKDDSR